MTFINVESPKSIKMKSNFLHLKDYFLIFALSVVNEISLKLCKTHTFKSIRVRKRGGSETTGLEQTAVVYKLQRKIFKLTLFLLFFKNVAPENIQKMLVIIIKIHMGEKCFL